MDWQWLPDLKNICLKRYISLHYYWLQPSNFQVIEFSNAGLLCCCGAWILISSLILIRNRRNLGQSSWVPIYSPWLTDCRFIFCLNCVFGCAWWERDSVLFAQELDRLVCSLVFAPSLSVHVWAAFGGSVYACPCLYRGAVCVGRGGNKQKINPVSWLPLPISVRRNIRHSFPLNRTYGCHRDGVR